MPVSVVQISVKIKPASAPFTCTVHIKKRWSQSFLGQKFSKIISLLSRNFCALQGDCHKQIMIELVICALSLSQIIPEKARLLCPVGLAHYDFQILRTNPLYQLINMRPQERDNRQQHLERYTIQNGTQALRYVT